MVTESASCATIARLLRVGVRGRGGGERGARVRARVGGRARPLGVSLEEI